MVETDYWYDDNGISTAVRNKLFLLLRNVCFKGVGIKDPYITSIILSSVNFLSTILGIYYVEKWGRKTCLLYGSTNLLFYMMTYATVGTFGRETDFSNIVLIIVTCCFIFWFAITLGPVTFVLVSELFPLRTRAISMAICTFINWMFNFLISLLTPMIVSKIDFKLGYIFAACLLALIIFSWILVPETRKRMSKRSIKYLNRSRYY